MKQTTNFNEYNIVGDDSSLTINNSSGSLVSFTNGNLGIGTISPTEKFEVNEGFILSNGSATSHGFELARDNFSTYQIKHLDGGLTIFNLNAARKEMTFKGNGRIGINNSSPIETLDVIGNIKADGILKLFDITDTQRIELNPDGDSYIKTKLAIGTSFTDTPQAVLHIQDVNPRIIRLQDRNYSNTYADIDFKDGSLKFLTDPQQIRVNSLISFSIDNLERLRINYEGNVGIGTTSPTERLDVVGNIKSSGYITGKRCGAAGYLALPVSVTVTTANTYYPIGVFTVPVAEDFVVGTTYPNGLKYSGTLAQTFHITWNATIESTSNNVTATIDIQKNGVSIAMSKMGTYAKTGGEIYNLSGQCVVDLDTNDEVRFVVTADNNGEVLTFDYFAASIKEFFD